MMKSWGFLGDPGASCQFLACLIVAASISRRHMHRPARVVVAGGILAVGLAIGTRFWLERQSHIAPPLPSNVTALDSDLATLIQKAADRVHEISDSPQA